MKYNKGYIEATPRYLIMNVQAIASTSNWKPFEKRPTWGTVTTRELSEVLGVPITSIHNWLLRGHFPEPEPRIRGQGNKNRFSISKIRSWLEGEDEDAIHWDWIRTHMHEDIESIEQAKWNAERYWKAYGVEKLK